MANHSEERLTLAFAKCSEPISIGEDSYFSIIRGKDPKLVRVNVPKNNLLDKRDKLDEENGPVVKLSITPLRIEDNGDKIIVNEKVLNDAPLQEGVPLEFEANAEVVRVPRLKKGLPHWEAKFKIQIKKRKRPKEEKIPKRDRDRAYRNQFRLRADIELLHVHSNEVGALVGSISTRCDAKNNAKHKKEQQALDLDCVSAIKATVWCDENLQSGAGCAPGGEMDSATPVLPKRSRCEAPPLDDVDTEPESSDDEQESYTKATEDTCRSTPCKRTKLWDSLSESLGCALSETPAVSARKQVDRFISDCTPPLSLCELRTLKKEAARAEHCLCAQLAQVRAVKEGVHAAQVSIEGRLAQGSGDSEGGGVRGGGEA